MDPQVVRKIPQNIGQDKERLYEEIMKLKSVINDLQDNNLKLRTRNTNLEREAAKYERIIEENQVGSMQKTQTQFGPPQGENAMNIRLKKQLKDLKTDLDKKTQEYDQIKKEFRITKIQELQNELIIYKEQCKKQKNRIDQMQKINTEFRTDDLSNEDVVKRQNDIIKQLKEDNIQLAQMVKQIEQEFNLKNQAFIDLEKQHKFLLKEKQFIKRQLHDQESKDFSKLRNESLQSPSRKNIYSSGNNQQENKDQQEVTQKLKDEIQEKIIEIENLNKKVRSKEKELSDQENQAKQIKHDLQDKLDYVTGEKRVLNKKLEELERKYNDLLKQNQKNKKLNNSNVQDQNSSPRKQETIIPDDDFNQQGVNNQSNQQINRKRVPKVNYADVTKIGKDLQFRLKAEQISLQECEEKLFRLENKEKGKSSIKELFETLQHEPFLISNKDSALLIARYLVEDNAEDFIILDEFRSNQNSIIKEVFRNLLGKYKLMEHSKFMNLHIQMAELITKFSSGIRENLKLYVEKKKSVLQQGTCQLEDWTRALEYIDIDLKEDQKDLITTLYFEDSQDTDIIYYENLLEKLNLMSVKKKYENEVQSSNNDQYLESQEFQNNELQESQNFENEEDNNE